MGSRTRQLRHTQQALTAIMIITVALILIALFILGYRVDWTGFNAQQSQPAKSLWDWMQLLIIPLALTFGIFLYSRVRYQADRNNISDSQREVILQAYLDRMSELLLNRNLLSREPEAAHEVRKMARVWTLTVLRRLDPGRKGDLFQFLYESGLISEWGGNFSALDLNGADLSEADLFGAYLPTANLSGVNLSGANLSRANLWRANLSEANLSEADLSGADLHEAYLCWNYRRKVRPSKPYLHGANLRKANLRNTNLSGADLSEANLNGAILDEADLRGAIITTEQLNKARSHRNIIR